MSLSDYELRILRETEDDLARMPPSRRTARLREVVTRYWLPALFGAVALLVTVLAGVFLIAAVAAPLAGAVCAVAGFRVARSSTR